MIVIDGLGSLPQLAGVSSASLLSVKNDCVKKLDEILGASSTMAVASDILDAPHSFSIDGFGVSKGLLQHIPSDFSLLAPTTAANAKRVLRGCQLPKPILLEGSPGVGKTSLITALAAVTRNELCRINLSDQTDLADLFGSDLPVEGGKPGEFAWKDAAFLTALQSGQWVLLDEMNLASQAVLEGLNAVLDHRGTVYLPELGRSFSRHPNFRIFAAQNPVGQGGGRKGLPKSFLNRFTRVYVQELSPEDLRLICGSIYPDFSPVLLEKMIDFNSRLHVETMVKRSFGRDGSPWEFNLRDVLRWLALVHSSSGLEQHPGHPIEHLRTIYLHRFRLSSDRARVLSLFNELFDETLTLEDRPWPSFTPSHVQFGHALLPRSSHSDPSASQLSLLQSHLSPLEAMAKCIDLGWLVIVSGPALSGKTSILRLLAQLSGRRLRQFSMNSGVDTMELLGSFEQADSRRRMSRINARLSALSKRTLATTVFDEARWSSIAAGLERLAGLAISDDVVSFVSAGAAIANELQAILVESEHGELAWVQSALSDLSAAGSSSGRFEWVDGELVQAITAGDWLVIENANLCNASVLDRINSLCETNGSLVLSERGSVDGVPQVLVPHPQFRLFMTLDPKHGELSRAMRNRGIEICLTDLSSPTDLDRLSRLSRTPSGDHANLSATQLARRSLSILSPSTPLLSTLPWDSLVLHDATLASLVPYDTDAFIPSTNMASTTTDTQQLANLSHLLEATSPNAIQISRHITSNFHNRSTASSSDLFCSALQSVSDSGLLQLLSSLEQGSSTELPSSFLASQVSPTQSQSLFHPPSSLLCAFHSRAESRTIYEPFFAFSLSVR
jgi:midasin